MSLDGARVLVVGGSSGIGMAIAEAALHARADVIIASRSPERLSTAAARLGSVAIEPVDIRDAHDVDRLAKTAGAIDHLVISAAEVAIAPFRDLALEVAQASFESKFWGTWRVARGIDIRDTGSITILTGSASRRYAKSWAVLSSLNAALEALTRVLALELAPVRVNAIAPGPTRTPLMDDAGEEMRNAFKRFVSSLPAKRQGEPSEIAAGALLLMSNNFITGTVLDIDGGAHVS